MLKLRSMHTVQFWRSWPRTYKRIGFVVAISFLFSLLFLWYSYFQHPSFSWSYLQELEVEEVPVHTFEQGPLELTVRGDNYFVFEQLLGNPISFHEPVGYIFIGVLFSCMIIWLSIVTLLKRLWHYIGMGLFILFIVSLRMEIVQVFGLPNKLFTAIVLAIYVGISFYFRFFKNKIPFLNRLIIFFITTAILATTIILLSTTESPLLHISANSLLAATVISVIFILMVAHEVIASFVYVVSQATSHNKSLNHFLAISIIYMINLALAYAYRAGVIEWNFMYVNLLFLLMVSGVLGIWGFRKREPQYQHIFPANPFGVYFILCMAITCFATVGYFTYTANDAPLVAIDSVIIYSHIGYGIIFLTYIFSNFIGMMAKNMPIHKVLYQPSNMPYFTFRFGGLIATLAFVFYNTWQVPVNNVLAGIHNAKGDVYKSYGDFQTAEAFYQRAGTYGFLNHRSNYAIAHIKGQQYHSLKERNFYNRASERRPTEFSYLNLSYTFQREQDWLKALLTLNRAKEDFPTSGPIANAMGVLYSKIDLLDSALFFFNEAINYDLTEDVAKANFVGVFAKNNLSVSADSLLTLIESNTEGVKSNVLALSNMRGSIMKLNIDLGKKTPLDLFSASLISNYVLNHICSSDFNSINDLDTTFIRKVVTLARDPVNANFSEPLFFVAALALYEMNRVWDALLLMEEVASFSEQKGRYNSIMALWTLEQGNPQGALKFLDYSLQQEYGDAEIVSAVALSENGNIDDALTLWNNLEKQDSTYGLLATKIIRALTISRHRINELTDDEKYIYCHYLIDPLDSVEFVRVISTLKNENLKVRILFEMSQKLFERDEIQAAIQIFQKIEGLQINNKKLHERIIGLEIEMLAKQKKFSTLANRIKGKETTVQQLGCKGIYYNALLSEWAGDSVSAQAQYRLLAKHNPYHEEATIKSAHYLGSLGENDFQAYTILVDALHHNPYSVKLLKSYGLEATRMGLYEYAASALERLQRLIDDDAMNKFLQKNHTILAPILL